MSYNSHLTLGARIAGGQHGDVYKGQDHVHGKVAVKVLRQNPGESTADWATRSAALLQEARHLKAATHPNIVQVHNLVRHSANNVLHLVTEFCDGGSIDAIYQNGPLPLPHARKIITDTCRGLEHIHSRGMIHRDIKPGNILRHGTAYKISDFGLVSDNVLLGYASADGYLCHLAPEVFGDPATSTPGVTSCKTDVWAMGMTVYRLLNGHQWFLRNFAGIAGPNDIRQMIIDGGFCHGLDWLPHVPESWRKFVRKTMHDDTVQRFPTAHAMSQALARLPVTPAWACAYTPTEATWTVKDDGRTVTVKWKVHSPRRHEWYAIRSGAGKRDFSAGGVQGKIIASTVARTELENFFASLA